MATVVPVESRAPPVSDREQAARAMAAAARQAELRASSMSLLAQVEGGAKLDATSLAG
jgi:hypothetical protein